MDGLINEGEGIFGGEIGFGFLGDMVFVVFDRGFLNENFLGEIEVFLGLVIRLEEVWSLVVFIFRFFIFVNSFFGRDDFFFGVGESVIEVEGYLFDSEIEFSFCIVLMRGIFFIFFLFFFMIFILKVIIEA